MHRRSQLRWLGWLLLASPCLGHAHSGGLNAEGCHHNRNTGDYHCHRQPPATEPPLLAHPSLATPEARPARGDHAGRPAYANCAAARTAGAAPVRRGQPGYGRHLDRDNDGIGCE